MALPPYQIYQAIQNLLVGDTQRDLWFDKPTFIFEKYARKGHGSPSQSRRPSARIIPFQEQMLLAKEIPNSMRKHRTSKSTGENTHTYTEHKIWIKQYD
jgi:hypothetical protein